LVIRAVAGSSDDRSFDRGRALVTTDEYHRHTPQQRSPVIRAARAGDALREITTMDGYDEAPEMYGVLTRLTQLTDLTGQVLDQARQWLRTQHRAGRIGTDNGGDVDAAIDALVAAAAAARAFSTAIDDAAGHVGHLTSKDAPTF
jgi:hypothetical protein